MARPIKRILIVGGGTAGWITAGLLAAKLGRLGGGGPKIQVIEAPDIPIIGVGEGTWPSMRTTLHTIGVSETDFLRACGASFKQGSKFIGWTTGAADDVYYHPYELPEGFRKQSLVPYWLSMEDRDGFSRSVCFQEHVCERNLAPKLNTSRDYTGVSNYAYHLDAGRFSEFIKDHCAHNLGVELIADHITRVIAADSGDIQSVQTSASGTLEADLFIDCTGMRALLLGEHFGVPLKDLSAVLPIDTALATQVLYGADEPIRSQTNSTAQTAGWIWDIGLQHRRGVGYVFSSAHQSDEDARRALQAYVSLDDAAFGNLTVRRIPIRPGYRERFWVNNCVAVGLSAGFLEPLEASAIMMIEASANIIADQMPVTREAMDVVSARFNRRFTYRWERVVDFLKLHYLLSQRKELFWRDSINPASVPDRLAHDLSLWKHQGPTADEFDSGDEAFPTASYQYILYGMGFETAPSPFGLSDADLRFGAAQFETVKRRVNQLLQQLETNRQLLDKPQGEAPVA